MNSNYLISIIFKAHLIILFMITTSYLIEKNSNWKLMFDIFKWKKSPEMADGAATFYSALYFIISLAVLIYDGYIKDRAPSDFMFSRWLLVMIVLTIIFRFVYYRYTGKDPNKSGEHYD
jgi:hypothetical protein